MYKLWLKAVVKAAQATPETSMLDLAGGTGDVTYAVCKSTPPAHVDLTDFNPQMLEVARERYDAGAACGVPCDFEVVDAQNIPYANKTYDLITCAYGIRNIPDRERAFAEAYRVLKPGEGM